MPRLFVALALPESIEQAIAQWQRTHQPTGTTAVVAKNLHITLRFIGQCSNQQVDDIASALGAIQVPSWHQSIDKIGRFNTPQIGYLCSRHTCSELIALKDAVHLQTSAFGRTPAHPSYIPHVTVFHRLAQRIDWQAPAPLLNWRVRHFSLFESAHGTYQELHRWPTL
ncbi:RNA 2',3'-cyclic phosphodiesterase [Echinimonas agarilytica]|uniref:RNA 2',3'-cyclic phosphodiesterase n=1 Tax=Echinimonas agarilytica TaxID=1215918 RepID=A0AA41W4Y1_9GAMM|nr:RNA 2',3'-cyclic phosphodiesterase [Echinimonas agarilytica]MCM2678764.1 RNA 2',3'-cyclic phosphodiesterase [Echinimonas agarilytica]